MSDAALHARATLDDLAKRRRHVTGAIVSLAAFYGLDPAPWLDEPLAAAETKPPIHETKPAKRDTTVQKHNTKGTAREKRPTKASSGAERILTALRTHGKPMAPKELAAAIDMDVSGLRYHVNKLLASRQVTAIGATSNRQLALA